MSADYVKMTTQDFTCIPLAGWGAAPLRLAVVLIFELFARVLPACSEEESVHSFFSILAL
jgi:hypothetical protein